MTKASSATAHMQRYRSTRRQHAQPLGARAGRSCTLALTLVASVALLSSCADNTSDSARVGPTSVDSASPSKAEANTPTLSGDSVTSSSVPTGSTPSSLPYAAMTNAIELSPDMTIPPMVAPEDCEGTPPILWGMAEYSADHAGMTVTEMRVEFGRMCGLPATHFDGHTAAELGLTEAELTKFQNAWEAVHR